MVLFENVNINQRVEVLRDGDVYSGTVKYKGNINGICGEWVGVELDLPGTIFSIVFSYSPVGHRDMFVVRKKSARAEFLSLRNLQNALRDLAFIRIRVRFRFGQR